jgi:hypothetical protein
MKSKTILTGAVVLVNITTISLHNVALADSVTPFDRSEWPPCFDLGFNDQFSNPSIQLIPILTVMA